jgi:hypothetical protein
MIRRALSIAVLGAAVGLGACEKQLTVTNPNAGDTKRVLGTPNDAEALIGTYWKRWMSGVYGSTTNIEGMANIFALQNYSSLANSCQNSHAPFSGATNFNQPGNTCSGEQFRLFTFMGEVNRVASSFLTQMDEGLTLGSDARNARARAFAYFLNGLALGYVALVHDSAAIVSPGMGAEDPGVLVGHRTLLDSSMAYLQLAIDETNKSASGDQGFPIPSTWIPSPTAMSKAEFTKLIRSYRARIRANMGRTPIERAATDWAAVVADAQNGITTNFQITTNTTTFNVLSWRNQYEAFGLWHQMPPFFIGMADVSGAYASWIATPIGDRGSGGQGFFMQTPDLRFPQGATRAAQQADFNIQSCQGASQVCKRYFVNRPAGGDQFAGLGWGFSNYDFVRFHSWRTSGDGTARNGNTPIMVVAEMDMLQAEGLFRAGNYAAAGALVNKTRTLNGLPAITTFDATTVVPGGASCVPQVPKGPAFNTIGCGTLFDAIKYEKRLETAYVHFLSWYNDGRGWGDLPVDTPTFWAIPFQDLQARGVASSAIYGTGIGAGNAPGSASARSGYGW